MNRECPTLRAQTELPALGIAFVLLTAALILSLGAASHAFTSAERPAMERQAAVSLSEQLVDDDLPLAARPNVLSASALESLNGSSLSETYGLSEEKSAHVQLDGESVAATDDVGAGSETLDGTSIERIVLLEERTERQLAPQFEEGRTVTLPRRSLNTTLVLSPPEETTIRSVRSNGRTVLHNESGLDGTFELDTSPLETTTLFFEALGPLSRGDVELRYDAPETRKATLVVTVDG